MPRILAVRRLYPVLAVDDPEKRGPALRLARRYLSDLAHFLPPEGAEGGAGGGDEGSQQAFLEAAQKILRDGGLPAALLDLLRLPLEVEEGAEILRR